MMKDNPSFKGRRDSQINVVPHYTRAWQQVKEGVESTINKVPSLPGSLTDVGHLFVGLAKAQYEAPLVRKDAVQRALNWMNLKKNKKTTFKARDMVALGKGLVEGPYQDNKPFGKLLLRCESTDELLYHEKVELCWALQALGQADSDLHNKLFKEVTSVYLDDVSKYRRLSLDVYHKMCDIAAYAIITKRELPDTNYLGKTARRQFGLAGYPEQALHDPFKSKVVEALKKALGNVCMDNTDFL